MSNENIKLVKEFVNGFSLETTPNVYKKYGSFKDLVDKNHLIYITYLPDENMNNVVETAKKLKLEGFNVVPHLPARTIGNKSELKKYIGDLSEKSGCDRILVIGGGGKQVGEINSSIEVLKTDYLSKYNYSKVGVAGHPEGNPDIAQEELDRAIIEKNNFAKKCDFKIYLATQFFFEATSLIDWENHLNKLGNQLDIHAGIPGPATLKTLISYAKSCGIGNSLRFLSKQALNITKLASTKSPDKLLFDLANYKNSYNQTKLAKLHFYAFGGIKKTSNWLNTLKSSEFIYNSKNGFQILEN